MASNEVEIDDIIATLSNVTINNTENVIPILNQISTSEPKTYENHDLAKPLSDLLLSSNNSSLKVQVAKCIAEVTKAEAQRQRFTNPEIIKYLLECISNFEKPDIEMVIQVCRALGNICYLNDDARNIIATLKGDEILVNLLDVNNVAENETDVQFAKVRCGLISNYLLGGEELSKRAMDLQIMDKIQNIIQSSVENVEKFEDLLINVLPPLSILTENVPDLNFDPILNKNLVKILAQSTNPDLGEMCLELIHYQAENDDVKLLLAKEGLCETIYRLLEKYKTFASTNEARALMKLACDLIVLILTGDESMNYLYSTSLLKYMEDWLESYDVDLLTTGVLALGNFARTDSHCIYMVENKVMNKLLDILSKNNGVDNDMRLQHALLSALRNLVIPKSNKAAVIEAGLVQTILPMLEIHQPPVVFKLLGTLRMTVDGQEKLALELLQNKTLISQLVHWSKSSDYAGVTGESLRLMAWLIKHAYHVNRDANVEKTSPVDDSSLKEFVKTEGAVESMVNMLTSQHLVMQNEALISLSILSTVLNRKDQTEINLDEVLIKCDLGEKLAEFISKGADTMTKEIVENLQTLMTLLRLSDILVVHLEKHNIDELLKSIPILVEYCTL